MKQKTYNLCILLNIILLIFIIYKLRLFDYLLNYDNKLCYNLKIYHYNFTDTKLTNIYNKNDYIVNTPNLLLVGSTHGNEPAGTIAVREFMKNIPKLKRGSVTIIEAVNPCGIINDTRESPNFGLNKIGGDINRTYPAKITGKIGSKQAQTVIKYLNIANYVIDFHEGYSWHKMNKSSVGATLTPNKYKFKDFKTSIDISENVVNTLNQSIVDEQKKWGIRNNLNCDIKRTLNCYSYLLKKPYVLVETVGQKDIQHIDIRKNENLTIINEYLRNLDML
jgi:predicted deacylase